MGWTNVHGALITRGSRLGAGPGPRLALGLSLGLLTLSAFGAASKGAAQTPPAPALRVPARLTVRPHEMATGTRTDRAGDQSLDSLLGAPIYVPQQCVGPRRCPLIVFLMKDFSGGWGQIKQWMVPVADKYGMIVLGPAERANGSDWDDPPAVKFIDAALKQTLKKFAIDPDKIAAVGFNKGVFFVGSENLNVFSRIVVLSVGNPQTVGVDPPNQTTEFLLLDGFQGSVHGNFTLAQTLRHQGHRVKQTFGFGLWHQEAGYGFVGQWLLESWTTPDPAARPRPKVVADPLPLLTPEALGQLTTFWTRFQQEPDSIRTTARQAHLQEVFVPVGQDRPSVVMADIPTLAAQYPAVAADLQAAGLTAQQHDAYRVALISAWITGEISKRAGPLDPASVSAKNILVRYAHLPEVEALWRLMTQNP